MIVWRWRKREVDAGGRWLVTAKGYSQYYSSPTGTLSLHPVVPPHPLGGHCRVWKMVIERWYNRNVVMELRSVEAEYTIQYKGLYDVDSNGQYISNTLHA